MESPSMMRSDLMWKPPEKVVRVKKAAAAGLTVFK